MQKLKPTRQSKLVSWNITRQMLFFKYHADNEGGRLVPDLVLFFEKASYETKEGGLQLIFNIFW